MRAAAKLLSNDLEIGQVQAEALATRLFERLLPATLESVASVRKADDITLPFDTWQHLFRFYTAHRLGRINKAESELGYQKPALGGDITKYDGKNWWPPDAPK